MDCMTCHDPHKNQRGNTQEFNDKCIKCHSGDAETICAEDSTTLQSNQNNCISCHMPLFTSSAIRIQTETDSIPLKVRTHFVDIYLDSI